MAVPAQPILAHAEPHVRLFGLGFLPQRLAVAYVKRSCGADYHDIRLLSARRLSSLLAPTSEVWVVASQIAEATRAGYSRRARTAIGAYNRACSTPVGEGRSCQWRRCSTRWPVSG